MPSSIAPEILTRLRARHLAFLEARLASPAAAEEWRANVAAVYDALLVARVGSVVDPQALAHAVDVALTSDVVERAVRPLARRLRPLILAELRAEKGKVRDRVPASAQQHLDALVTRPGLMPERLLREVAEQDAIEEIMRDVLYDGFKEFSEKVNPFTAEWGIPLLLKRVGVIGGAVAKGVDAVKAEFDHRLEPEIRRFLAGFSRRGLESMVDATIARSDQPTSIAVRRHLVAWVLEQELAELTRSADEEAIALVQEIALDVAAAELSRAAGRERRRALIVAAVEGVREKTVGEALADLGITLRVDTAAIAEASWPVVLAVLASAPVKAWLENLVAEFYDGELAEPLA